MHRQKTFIYLPFILFSKFLIFSDMFYVKFVGSKTSINKVIISNLQSALVHPSRALQLSEVLHWSSRVNANVFCCSASWECLCVVVK